MGELRIERVDPETMERWRRATHKEWDCVVCRRVHTVPIGVVINAWEHGLTRECHEVVPGVNGLSARPVSVPLWLSAETEP